VVDWDIGTAYFDFTTGRVPRHMTSRGDYAFKQDVGSKFLKVYRGGLLFLGVPFGNNGGGRLMNNYSVLMEIKVDELPYGGLAALLQTAKWNEDEAEVYISGEGGLGFGGSYGAYDSPKILVNKWHLVAITIDCIEGQLCTYLDGVQIQNCKPNEMVKDGRFALQDQICLFGSKISEETRGCNIRFLNFYNRVLSGQDIWDIHDSKQQESKWECSVCSLKNLRDATICAVCDTPRIQNEVTETPGILGPNQWQCPTCTFFNPKGVAECGVCGAISTNFQ